MATIAREKLDHMTESKTLNRAKFLTNSFRPRLLNRQKLHFMGLIGFGRLTFSQRLRGTLPSCRESDTSYIAKQYQRGDAARNAIKPGKS